MQGLAEATELLRRDTLALYSQPSSTPTSSTFLVAMSERTGMTVSQVTDEVLYFGLIEMQELPNLTE